MRLTTDHVKSAAERISELDGVRTAVIVAQDGSSLPGAMTGSDDELLGALTGAIFATINRSMQRSGLAQMESLLISATEGEIHASRIEDSVLVVLAGPDTNAGMIRLEMRRAREAGQPAGEHL